MSERIQYFRCNDCFTQTRRVPGVITPPGGNPPPSCKKCHKAMKYVAAETTATERVSKALSLADRFGCIGGDHHKAWVVDQMVRALTGPEYGDWVARHKDAGIGPDTCDWDEGIAP